MSQPSDHLDTTSEDQSDPQIVAVASDSPSEDTIQEPPEPQLPSVRSSIASSFATTLSPASSSPSRSPSRLRIEIPPSPSLRTKRLNGGTRESIHSLLQALGSADAGDLTTKVGSTASAIFLSLSADLDTHPLTRTEPPGLPSRGIAG